MTEKPPRPPDQQQAMRALFHNRDFRLLWAGQLFSQVGDQCLLIAAITLITHLSRSPLAILIPAVSVAVPQLVFGLVGGVMADRWNRKQVMIVADIMRGLIVLCVLFVTRVQDLWILYLAAAGLALMGVFFYPARNAAIPNIVPNGMLLAANSMIQGSYIVALILGPVIAGAAVEIWAPLAIVLDSISFFASAIIIAVMNIPETVQEYAVAATGDPLSSVYADGGRWEPMGTSGHRDIGPDVPPAAPSAYTRKENSVWEDMKAGLDFIRHNHALRQVLVIMAIATLGIGAIVLLAIPHLKAELEAGGLEYGIAMSMLGVGSVAGGLMVSRLSRRLSTSTIVGGMLVAAGLAIIAFAFVPNYTVVLISIAVIGMCVVMARGALDTIAQALSPDGVRGRVQSAVNMLVVAATTLAEGVSALLGSLIGVQVVFGAAGILTTVTGVVAIFVLRGAARLVSRGTVVREVA